MDEERDFLMESRMILKGLEGIPIEKRHLEAVFEAAECNLIRIANELEIIKKKVLE